ncbi:ATP dependent DNA ligase domain-containing protein [Podospora appendiculata]|uniref:DNA ligase n=1 Tax=Podospora appendiculata TaxID=314037 RepID=A0AAE0XF02_9PEZI|nr:ATP dependent DNA ligase domain-containing protein [Podospora appendiculata]
MSGTSRPKREDSPDEEAIQEDQRQYGAGPLSLEELDEHFPNRPHNRHKTLPFSELFTSLFNPLTECKPSSTGPAGAGSGATHRKTFGGRAGPAAGKPSYHEQRRHIIERFVGAWRARVGNDIYPAMRLILPDKDRDRGVYGLKESAIGKLLVKVMKIDRNSEDGYALMHWKLPGPQRQHGGGAAGDFAGRCFEVLGKRQMRSQPGEMSVGEVNVLLDRLAAASGEAEQVLVFEEVYRGMNAEEMMWLVRIVLKDMRVGATERTFLGLWHPDAQALFSVSSSLRRVCWELWDVGVRLEQEETGVMLMSCFQPQLAQFQMATGFEKLVKTLGVEGGDADGEFWIEEKLDGERMQMHMMEDETVPGGRRFAWWSRKAKEYTYLYGEHLFDEKGALTRFLGKAFDDGVRNLILDGEMITWDPEVDKIVAFGTLKTAALEQQKNPFQTGPRPLFRMFDILLLNDKSLTEYALTDRRRALARAVVGKHRRLEIHPYEAATSPDAIEPLLRKVVAEASEGLVLKNPRSRYQLNSRNNSWIKVKPEYMAEFGEELDCVVIGGYYGSGRRGGTLSSFLCGLRASENMVKAGASPEKCLSIFKVGGGFRAEDYAEVKHHTDGKWRDWDPASPPSAFIELGGGERFQYERPDVWIRPRDSIVVSVKAASFAPSDQFAMGWTMRFPRLKRLRLDKAWDAGLSMDEFEALRGKVKQEEQERKAMEMESRKRKSSKRVKRELVIAGTEDLAMVEGGDEKKKKRAVFEGLEFCVLSEALKPAKMSKPALEKLIKDHGGRVVQQVDTGRPEMILLADKNVVKVASLKKTMGDHNVDIVRPRWVTDCLAQKGGGDGGFLLPFEEKRHLFCATEEVLAVAKESTDPFGDSYARDVDVLELRKIVDGMGKMEGPFDVELFLEQLDERSHGGFLEGLRGFLFRRCRVLFVLDEEVSGSQGLRLRNYVRFGDGTVVEDDGDDKVTHVVIIAGDEDEAAERELAAEMRYKVSSRRAVPRIVTRKWVEDCWREGTLLDEESYAPR